MSDSPRVAVVGFGHQGEAQALNLRDAGWEVVVGARAGGTSQRRARDLGFAPLDPAEALRACSWAAILIADEALSGVWPKWREALAPHTTVVFAHGFNLLYGALEFPSACDVVLVSPTGPGRVLRQAFERAARLPAYIAAHRDATGHALESAERYAGAIGCGPLWRTTVSEETEVDLFGEQTVLCGGMNALVTAAFETLVGAGYSPEIAYLECVHQLKYLADLLHERGVAGMREGISGTALFGDLTRGPRVIGEASRAAMAQALAEIQSGEFARDWMAEAAAGRPWLAGRQRAAASHPIEAARRSALGGAKDRGSGG